MHMSTTEFTTDSQKAHKQAAHKATNERFKSMKEVIDESNRKKLAGAAARTQLHNRTADANCAAQRDNAHGET
jgi:hypothetical protein